jgi:excisionase family DNA binding protein
MGAEMTDMLEQDAEALHRAIRQGGNVQEVPLHLSTIQYVAGVVDARLKLAQEILGPEEEVTPNRAAELLGMSRPRVRRLMDEGVLPFRMVGSHHRIPLSVVEDFRAAERVRMELGMAELSEVQNDLGLTE